MPSERRSDSDLMQLVEPGFNNPRVAARGLPQPAVLTAALARPSTTVFTHPAKTALRTTKRPYSRAFLKYRYRDSNPGYRRERAAEGPPPSVKVLYSRDFPDSWRTLKGT